MKCPTCETGNLVASVRDVPYVYKGKKTVIKAVKGKFCDNPKCRDVVMDIDESARTSKAMLAFNKKVNARLSPIDLLTEVRGKLKLTQQQAAEVFGGGPNAFSRYESGKTKPPLALVKLFKVLSKHPELFEEIAESKTSRGRASATSKRKPRRLPRSAHASTG
jgi:HTH-type transcriptional regulator/antitoxin MqsA